MKKITALFLCLAVVLGMTACGEKKEPAESSGEQVTEGTESEGTEENETTTEEETYVYPESTDNFFTMKSLEGWVKLHGRQRFMEDGSLTCDWSGSGFTIRVNSAGGTFKVSYRTAYEVYFSVHVDGEEVLRPCCPTESESFEFELPEGEHTVSVYKEKEVSTTIGTVTDLLGITFEGEILKREADKALYIEVIGDSIACGDGSLGVYTAGENWKNEDHSATHSFSFFLAKKADADLSIVARGGIGLVKEAGDFTMDILYDGMCFYRDKTKYEVGRVPDIIICELGANDTSNSTETEYYDKLSCFIEHLRKMYGPDVPIVWVGKGERNYNSMNRYMATNSDDKKLYAVRFAYGGSGSAALKTQTSGHPSAAEQEEFANAIYDYLKQQGLVK